MKKYLYLTVAALFLMGAAGGASAASFADLAFVIDQSGSMSGEFSWLGNSLSGIDTGMQNAGVTANYGVAGYEEFAGSADASNVWQDLSSDINNVVNAVNAATVYGGYERGYHAAEWSANNFSWTGGDYKKLMILITDEPNDERASFSYDGLTGEAALAKMIDDNDIYLNVITFQSYYQYWDDAVYTNGSYSGLFDLDELRNDPEGFTKKFTDAKISEVIINTPEPATMMLLGLGLVGLAGLRRRMK